MSAQSGKTPRSLPPLTQRQERILDVIKDAVLLRGYAPSIREIGDAVNLQSTSSVAYQLRELEKKGYLRRDPRKPRAVDIRTLPGHSVSVPKVPIPASVPIDDMDSEAKPPARYVPLIGTIAAGTPITAEQNIDDYLPLPESLIGEGGLYALRVQGDSMIEAGILNGDIVIIRQQPVAEQGQIVAAMIDGEATIKELHRDSSGVWLLPRNADYDPIPAENATILGRAVTVIRSL